MVVCPRLFPDYSRFRLFFRFLSFPSSPLLKRAHPWGRCTVRGGRPINPGIRVNRAPTTLPTGRSPQPDSLLETSRVGGIHRLLVFAHAIEDKGVFHARHHHRLQHVIQLPIWKGNVSLLTVACQRR